MHHIRTLIYFLISICLFIDVRAQDRHEDIEITVEPYKSLSYGAFFKSLELISNDPSTDYISGFEFEWGNSYVLKVKKTYLAEPPMDASSIVFSLREVVSTSPADPSFTFPLLLECEFDLGSSNSETPRVALIPVADLEYRYMDEINMVVPPELFGKFSKVIFSNASLQGTFKFLANGKIQLVDI